MDLISGIFYYFILILVLAPNPGLSKDYANTDVFANNRRYYIITKKELSGFAPNMDRKTKRKVNFKHIPSLWTNK
ncbi:unnamed protein product [Arctia plantaginis]|uniref:Uncharacterized protein n=1 Tax=Arctia plantaginis TaxID=874455 RepID=A0A8S1BN27_ARCPL|nr:unnamed protein product [Arctia plantaginis]CAB3262447.1 unnamed protein product [Arctia plantaginis]